MKMICAQATTSARRDNAVDAVVQKYPELRPQSVNWNTENDQTIIELSLRDESKVERLASEMRSCGFAVKVMTEEEYYLAAEAS